MRRYFALKRYAHYALPPLFALVITHTPQYNANIFGNAHFKVNVLTATVKLTEICQFLVWHHVIYVRFDVRNGIMKTGL